MPAHGTRLHEESRCEVRSLTTGSPTGPGARPGHVVVVPGLGALGYLVPFVQELGRCGLRATLLDLPGFGRRDEQGSPPTVTDVAAAVVRWCDAVEDDDDEARHLVLLGHSTGAQSALHAALRLQELRPPAAVVLAGPVVAPNQRSLPRLLATAPMAYRADSPRELRVLGDYGRAGRDVLRLLRSAIADRPERAVRQLRVPLLVTRRDAFAPPGWLVTIAHAAASRCVRVVRLPGSHNNPFTHRTELASVVQSFTAEALARPRPRGARGQQGQPAQRAAARTASLARSTTDAIGPTAH